MSKMTQILCFGINVGTYDVEIKIFPEISSKINHYINKKNKR